MQLMDFLSQFVEQYLFADLATMATATPPTQAGHLGYPMLMSCAGESRCSESSRSRPCRLSPPPGEQLPSLLEGLPIPV